MIFLQPEAREHFTFTMGKPDRKMGDNIRVVEYVEDMRPTLIVGLPGQDMPAYGRFWIDNDTGRVVKAEVRVDQKGIKANLTTVFRTDERLGIDVPAEMREDYELENSHVTGIATYSRFRRFEVNATEELAPPPPDATPAQTSRRSERVLHLIDDLAVLDRAAAQAALEHVARLFEHPARRLVRRERRRKDAREAVRVDRVARHGDDRFGRNPPAPEWLGEPVPDLGRHALDIGHHDEADAADRLGRRRQWRTRFPAAA